MQLPQLDSEHVEQLMRLIDAMHKKGLHPQAQTLLQEALPKTTQQADIRICLAECYIQSGNIEGAQKELETALIEAPNHPEIPIGLTYCYISRGDKQQALEQISIVQKTDPEEAQRLLSAVYENVQNF